MREAEQDATALMAECATPSDGFEATIAETLQSVTRLKGAVKFVAPGSLPNDGKVIADERPVSRACTHTTRRPLFPKKRTFRAAVGMSALGRLC
jgi:hypothetical protein